MSNTNMGEPATREELAEDFSIHADSLANLDIRRKHFDGDNSRLEGALGNDTDTLRHIQREKVLHRRVIQMSLAGMTNLEISEVTGYSENWVSDILRQPWARAQILAATKAEGFELKQYLAKEGMNCLKNLVAVANRDDIKPADYINANAKVVDRWLGKETQVFTINDSKPEELPDDDLDRRIRERLDAATSRSN